MAAIFFASATPAVDIPHFGALDYAVKKSGHFLSYALLALAYRRGLGTAKRRDATAWMLAVIYALLDEFHQSFVPGRHPSLLDALLFDGGGALAALLLGRRLSRSRSRIPSNQPSDGVHPEDGG